MEALLKALEVPGEFLLFFGAAAVVLKTLMKAAQKYGDTSRSAKARKLVEEIDVLANFALAVVVIVVVTAYLTFIKNAGWAWWAYGIAAAVYLIGLWLLYTLVLRLARRDLMNAPGADVTVLANTTFRMTAHSSFTLEEGKSLTAERRTRFTVEEGNASTTGPGTAMTAGGPGGTLTVEAGGHLMVDKGTRLTVLEDAFLEVSKSATLKVHAGRVSTKNQGATFISGVRTILTVEVTPGGAAASGSSSGATSSGATSSAPGS